MTTSQFNYHITLEEKSSPEDMQAIAEGLYLFNRQHTPEDNYHPLRLFLRDSDQKLVGGLLGETYWGWLHVSVLWLQEDVRRQGYGSHLLAQAEQEARRRGCHAVHLDTLSFQALAFYEHRGYQVFGTLHDHPLGHTRYFLTKKLR